MQERTLSDFSNAHFTPDLALPRLAPAESPKSLRSEGAGPSALAGVVSELSPSRSPRLAASVLSHGDVVYPVLAFAIIAVVFAVSTVVRDTSLLEPGQVAAAH